MSKIEEYLKEIGCHGGGIIIGFEVDKLITLVREECNQWIPVSERLPDESGWFNVCVDNDDSQYVDKAFFEKNEPNDTNLWVSGWEECEIQNVTHWMPLPTPPAK